MKSNDKNIPEMNLINELSFLLSHMIEIVQNFKKLSSEKKSKIFFNISVNNFTKHFTKLF